MKKVMFAVMAVMMGLMFIGCTTATIDFWESHTDVVAHDKALEMLGTDRSDSGYTYKATAKSVQCLKDRIAKDGYYTLQADIDCAENAVGRE